MKTLLAAAGVLAGMWLLFNLLGAFLVGWIARKIFPARDRVGWGMTLLIGFLGGIVGKILFYLCRWPTRSFMGFVASVVGAFLLLFAYHVWRSTQTKT